MKHAGLLWWLFQKTLSNHNWLVILNPILWLIVPFNRPHRLRVKKFSESCFEIVIPYQSVNLNHLRTIHACAMITAAEYCTGLYLLAHLSPKSYRLVMKEIKSEFVKRAIGPVSFKFAPEPAWLEVGKSRLATHQPWYAEALIEGTDSSGETVCRVQVQWQLKAWASSSHSVAL